MCNKDVVNLKSHFKSAKHLKRCCTFVGETSANEGDQKIYRYEGINNTIDPVLFLSSVKEHVKNKCLNSSFPNFKLTIELNAQLYKEKPDGSREVKDDWFNGGCMQAINHISSFDEVYKEMVAIISEKITKYTNEGSGWVLDRLLEFIIIVARYQPIRSGSYIPLPKKYQNPKFGLIKGIN